MLYERAESKYFGAGIQSRLFLAVLPSKANGGMDYEVWEWVATAAEESATGDLFVRKDPDTLQTEAVAMQFSPVIEFWRENEFRLPATNKELDLAVKLVKDAQASAKSPWRIIDYSSRS